MGEGGEHLWMQLLVEVLDLDVLSGLDIGLRIHVDVDEAPTGAEHGPFDSPVEPAGSTSVCSQYSPVDQSISVNTPETTVPFPISIVTEPFPFVVGI